MSGLNFTNISGAFGAASSSLQNAYDWKMRQRIEELRDQRAENLMRMKFGLESQHAEHMQERSLAVQTAITERSGQIQKEISERNAKTQADAQSNYMDRLASQQAAERALERQREDANNARDMKILAAKEQAEANAQVTRIDAQMDQLHKDYAAAVNQLDAKYETDPVKKQNAIINDPTIVPILNQLQTLNTERAGVIRAHILQQQSYGNPVYQGVKLAPGPADLTPGSSGGAGSGASGGPSLIPVPNGGSNTMMPGGGHTTGDTTQPPPPDAGAAAAAVTPPANAGPRDSLAGMPPTAGVQRPPVTSFVAPARSPPQLIPMGPRGDLAAPSNPAGQFGPPPPAPALIPQQPQGY